MTQQQYRDQFESQVKDLRDQYLQIHGEAPAVTIEWGNLAPAAPTPEVVPEDTSGRIAVCNACSNEKHGVKTRIAVKHTCGK